MRILRCIMGKLEKTELGMKYSKGRRKQTTFVWLHNEQRSNKLNKNNIRKILDLTIERKRGRRRPKNRWNDCLQINLKEKDLQEDD